MVSCGCISYVKSLRAHKTSDAIGINISCSVLSACYKYIPIPLFVLFIISVLHKAGRPEPGGDTQR